MNQAVDKRRRRPRKCADIKNFRVREFIGDRELGPDEDIWSDNMQQAFAVHLLDSCLRIFSSRKRRKQTDQFTQPQ
jgi:hypothetical protein